jgi:transposase-like protein
MIRYTFQCRDCGSTNIVKNGHNASGNQQYHCKDCGTYGVLDPEEKGYTEQEKERILRAYRERGSMRAISRIFGVSQNTLSRWPAKRQLKRDVKPNR